MMMMVVVVTFRLIKTATLWCTAHKWAKMESDLVSELKQTFFELHPPTSTSECPLPANDREASVAINETDRHKSDHFDHDGDATTEKPIEFDSLIIELREAQADKGLVPEVDSGESIVNQHTKVLPDDNQVTSDTVTVDQDQLELNRQLQQELSERLFPESVVDSAFEVLREVFSEVNTPARDSENIDESTLQHIATDDQQLNDVGKMEEIQGDTVSGDKQVIMDYANVNGASDNPTEMENNPEDLPKEIVKNVEQEDVKNIKPEEDVENVEKQEESLVENVKTEDSPGDNHEGEDKESIESGITFGESTTSTEENDETRAKVERSATIDRQSSRPPTIGRSVSQDIKFQLTSSKEEVKITKSRVSSMRDRYKNHIIKVSKDSSNVSGH